MSDHNPPFKENVVIITGASSGIGREMALQLADQGAWLALAARSADALNEVAAACEVRGGRAHVIPTDVTVQDQCSALVEQTISAFGRIDTVVHNAGVGMWARFDEMTTLEPFEALMRINYLSAVWLTHYALPHLKQTRGRIVAMSSVAGKTGVPMRSGYAASKAAMDGFFETLRIELAETGISVTILSPDFVATGIRERNFSKTGERVGKGKSPVQESEVMPVEDCARISIKAMAKRKRSEIMSTRGKIGQWVKLIAPALVDRIAKRAVERGK